MIQRFHVSGRLPGLNDMLDAAKRGRGRFNQWARIKKAAEQRIALCARAAKLKPVKSKARFEYVLIEPNRRRDPGNAIAGAVKCIEDALVSLGILSDDGWDEIAEIKTTWIVDKSREGVEVTIEEIG